MGTTLINRGYYAENLVTSVLRVYGFSIIARNINLKFSELDIVALYKDVIYIVEVRHRKYISTITDVINYKKIYKIIRAGQLYFKLVSRIYNINKVTYYLAIVDNKYRIKFLNFSNLI